MKRYGLLLCVFITTEALGQHSSKTGIEFLVNVIKENTPWNIDTLKMSETDSSKVIVSKQAACLGLAVRQLGEVYFENKTNKEIIHYFFYQNELIKIETINHEGFSEYYFSRWKPCTFTKNNLIASKYIGRAKQYMKTMSRAYKHQ